MTSETPWKKLSYVFLSQNADSSGPVVVKELLLLLFWTLNYYNIGQTADIKQSSCYHTVIKWLNLTSIYAKPQAWISDEHQYSNI